jgi:hypothetical protein
MINGIRYDRRAGDQPADYAHEVHEEWVCVNRAGRPVPQNGSRFTNWLARMLHGVLWVRCRIVDGVPVFPGRLK